MPARRARSSARFSVFWNYLIRSCCNCCLVPRSRTTRQLPISSKTYAAPLTIDVVHPAHVTVLALGLHVTAAIALYLSALPLALVAAAVAVLSASGYLVVFRLRYFRRVIWRSDGTWLLLARDGRQFRARLKDDSLAVPFITLLSFDSLPPGKRHSILVVPTKVNAGALRRLRVRLRIAEASAG